MKYLTKLSLIMLLVLAAVMAFPGTVSAQGPDDDGQVVFGGNYRLKSGETLRGDLAVFGGNAVIEEDATVEGSIVISGGSLDLSGTVEGDVSVIGGSVNINSTAEVDGNVNSLGGTIHTDDDATIEGRIIEGREGGFSFNLPDVIGPRAITPFRVNFSPFLDFFWGIFNTLALAALAMLIVLLAPLATRRAANAIAAQPVLTGAFGLITIIVAVLAAGILAITLILIPVSLLALVVLVIALVFGWIALGLEVGRRMEVMFKTNWSDPVSAGLGTLVVSLIAAVIGWIPCVGWLLAFVFAMVGLGSVVLSRFGTRDYVPPVAAGPVVVPVAPVPPAPVNPVVTPETTTVVPEPFPPEPEPPASERKEDDQDNHPVI